MTFLTMKKGNLLKTTTGTEFILEEFYIDGAGMNYTFLGHTGDPTCYKDCDHHLVYIKENELEMVKNFLLTIRD